MAEYPEGATGTAKDGTPVIRRNGAWVPRNAPAGPQGPVSPQAPTTAAPPQGNAPRPRPDLGQGILEMANGQFYDTIKRQMYGSQTKGATPEMRGRLEIGYQPSLAAEGSLQAATRTGNPLNTVRGAAATILQGKGDNGSSFDALGRVVGGQDFQNITQASKTFENAFMPIFSGAQVTESEAQRMIRANMPQMGESRETLRRKELNRQLMLNGAARLGGYPLPFPDVGALDFNNRAELERLAPAPAGTVETKILGGKTYHKRADGSWVED